MSTPKGTTHDRAPCPYCDKVITFNGDHRRSHTHPDDRMNIRRRCPGYWVPIHRGMVPVEEVREGIEW